GFGTATIGVVLMGLLTWLIYRSRLPGSGLIEYMVMFPQAVPRLVFAFGLMWAWVVFPIPIYGTLWLLLIAYLTVLLPLGVRTIAVVMLQIDKSLEECAQMRSEERRVGKECRCGRGAELERKKGRM